jgi:hypothetical protein
VKDTWERRQEHCAISFEKITGERRIGQSLQPRQGAGIVVKGCMVPAAGLVEEGKVVEVKSIVNGNGSGGCSTIDVGATGSAPSPLSSMSSLGGKLEGLAGVALKIFQVGL